MRSRSSRIVMASAWLLAALGAVPTSAQQPATPAYRDRLEGRLDKRALPPVERVIDSAYAQGIPAEPLVDKALEGQSKGASSEQIVAAVRRLAGELATARTALGGTALTSELTAGALALRSGVDAKSLQKLRTARPGQPLSVALGVLSGLIASGVPVNTATQSIFELTKNGIADEQLVAFRRDIERDVGMGASPAAAVFLHESALSLSLAHDGTGSVPTAGGAARPGKQRP